MSRQFRTPIQNPIVFPYLHDSEDVAPFVGKFLFQSGIFWALLICGQKDLWVPDWSSM